MKGSRDYIYPVCSTLEYLVRERLLGVMANNGSRQKVIRAGEVEQYIQQGWEYVASLPDDRMILKLPA